MPWIRLSPEEQVLLELSNNAAAAKKTYAVVQKLAGLIDWQQLLALIRQNQLQAICKDSFNSPVFQSVAPEEFMRHMIADQLAIQHMSAIKKQTTADIVRSLTNAGIRFVIMKTLPHEHVLFQAPIKIPGDLDILLPVSAVKLAAGILTKLGYKCFWNHKKTIKNALIHQDFYAPLSEHIFIRGNTTVELHTAIVNSSSFTSRILSDYNNRLLTQELYNQKQHRLYHGIPVYIFSPTALFVSLFVHLLYQHNLQSAVRYYELFRVVRTYKKSIRWDEVLRLIRTYHLIPYFHWFACLFNDLFPNSLPKDILQSALKYRASFRLPQRILYSIMKQRLFHPSDLPFKDNEKRICWAIMNKQIFSSAVSSLRRTSIIPPL